MKHQFKYTVVAALLVVGAAFAMAAVGTFEATAQVSSVSTPRATNGKPDLSGLWNGHVRRGFGAATTLDEGENFTRLLASRRCAPNQTGCRDNTNQANDAEFTSRTGANRPLYKPEHWDKVQFLDYDTNFSDPMFRCIPLGVPRVGPPTRILQLPDEMIMLYVGRYEQSGGQDHDYRIIPTDGRKHDPDHFPNYWGDAVGHWEGETFVVVTVGRNDTTWLAGGIWGGGGGYFHSYDLKVTERFRRDGVTLHYDVTVEDPEVLLEPWVMSPRTLQLNPDSKAKIAEAMPCQDFDSAIVENRIRH